MDMKPPVGSQFKVPLKVSDRWNLNPPTLFNVGLNWLFFFLLLFHIACLLCSKCEHFFLKREPHILEMPVDRWILTSWALCAPHFTGIFKRRLSASVWMFCPHAEPQGGFRFVDRYVLFGKDPSEFLRRTCHFSPLSISCSGIFPRFLGWLDKGPVWVSTGFEVLSWCVYDAFLFPLF